MKGVCVNQKNVTLSIDENIYDKYKEYCNRNAIALSRSIEKYMSSKIEEEKAYEKNK